MDLKSCTYSVDCRHLREFQLVEIRVPRGCPGRTTIGWERLEVAVEAPSVQMHLTEKRDDLR